MRFNIMAVCLLLITIVTIAYIQSDESNAESVRYGDLFDCPIPTYHTNSNFDMIPPDNAIELIKVDNYTYWVKEDGNDNYYAQLTNIGVVTEGQVVIVPRSIEYNGKECPIVSVGLVIQPFVLSEYDSYDYICHVGLTDNLTDQPALEYPKSGYLQHLAEPVHYSLVFEGSVEIRNSAFNEFNLFKSGKGYAYCLFTKSGVTSISGNVTYIGDWSFAYSCINEITLSADATYVGDHAFYKCDDLVKVFWDSNADIPDYAFSQDRSISSFVIRGSPKRIGEYALNTASISSIVIPDSVIDIGEHAFEQCIQLSSASIGAGMTAIPATCFNSCNNLSNVTVAGVIREVGNSAFYGTSLQSFDFSNIESIGDYAFYTAFSGNELVLVDLSKVTHIGDRAFNTCTAPMDLTLSSNLQYIGEASLAISGDLINSNLTIPEGCVIGPSAFAGSKISSIVIGGGCTIGTKAFLNCDCLVSVSFGNDCILESSGYGNSIFGGSGLKSVLIPSSLTIGNRAFNNCMYLETVVFEGTRLNIGQWFENCISLRSVDFPENLESISDHAFYGCTALDISMVTLTVTKEDVLTWGPDAFTGTASVLELPLFEGELEGSISFLRLTLADDGGSRTHSFVTDISGAENSMSLGEDFYSYAYLMPDDLTGFYERALRKPMPQFEFSSSYRLYQVFDRVLYDGAGTTLIKMPYDQQHHLIMPNVVSIAPYACNQTALVSIIIPGTVTNIGEGAFSYSKLNRITFEEGLVSIGDRAFRGTALGEVSLPSTLEYIGDYAFSDVIVDIPAGSLLKHIGNQGLKIADGGSVVVPSGITEYGDLPFGYGMSAVYLDDVPSVYPELLLRSSIVRMSAGAFTDIWAHPVGVCFYLPLGTDISSIPFSMLLGCEEGYFGGYYVLSNDGPVVVDDVADTDLGRLYVYSSVGIVSSLTAVADGEQLSVSLALGDGWTLYDVDFSMSKGFAIIDPTSQYPVLRFIISGFEDGAILFLEERIAAGSVVITFDSEGGSDCPPIVIGDGRTMSSLYPIPSKNRSEFVVWVDSSGNEYHPYTPIDSDLSLYAVWKGADPRVIFDNSGHISVTISGKPASSGDRVPPNGIVNLEWLPKEGYTFECWIITTNGDSEIIQSRSYTFSVSDDTVVELSEGYYIPSDSLRYEYSVDFSTDIREMYLQWSTEYYLDTSGILWTGGSSTPLVVNDRLYSRGGDYLYMYDLDTGRILKKVETVPFTGYYHYVGYAHGMIFDYTSGMVYDTDLNYLMESPYMASKILWDDSGTYMFGGGGIRKYTSDLSQLLWSFGIDSGFVTYTSYGVTGGVQIYEDHLYWVGVNSDRDLVLQSIGTDGNGFHEKVLSEYRNCLLDDGWISCYDDTLYLTVYSTGLFGDDSGGVGGGIIALSINDGAFAEEHRFYKTNNEANSAFVVHNGRGYVNAGGDFYVYEVDGTELNLIYSYIHKFYTHGGIVLNDLPDSDIVEILLIPYDPTSSVFVFFDSPGQTVPQYRNIMVEVTAQYNTQGVRFTDDGRLFFYNDAGNMYMLTSTKPDSVFFIILEDNRIYCKDYAGSFQDALEASGLSEDDCDYMFGKGAYKAPLEFDDSLVDRYSIYLFSDINLKSDDYLKTIWYSDEYGTMSISNMRSGRMYLDGAVFFLEKDEYPYYVKFVDTSGNEIKDEVTGKSPVGTTLTIDDLIDRAISGYSFKSASSDVFTISYDESKNVLILTYVSLIPVTKDLRENEINGVATINDLQDMADNGAPVKLLLSQGTIELDSEALTALSKLYDSLSVRLETVNPISLTDSQRNSVPEGSIVISISLESAGAYVHDLGGKAKVTLPVDIAGDNLKVWYLGDSGEMSEVINAEFSDGRVTFTTDHFSYYVIGDAPASDNEDVINLVLISVILAALIVIIIGGIFAYKRLHT